MPSCGKSPSHPVTKTVANSSLLRVDRHKGHAFFSPLSIHFILIARKGGSAGRLLPSSRVCIVPARERGELLHIIRKRSLSSSLPPRHLRNASRLLDHSLDEALRAGAAVRQLRAR